MHIELRPEPLTRAAFAPFGDVIETTGHDFLSINYGHTERYHDLMTLDALEAGGKPTVSIFRTRPRAFPIALEVVERHPLGSQAFICLERRPFITVVAPPTAGDQPDPGQLRAFLVGSSQGINYRRGTWHHYLFSLEQPADFICIDRSGGQVGNCDEYRLEETVFISNT
ncbi:MAG: ureidoglycolate lyase [Thiothrix sp.]|nr:ureidoglycolate lyase [Thiothrix sp.]HPQ97004.1 ureidoglycolate lyase [Thiolinea sp.]